MLIVDSAKLSNEGPRFSQYYPPRGQYGLLLSLQAPCYRKTFPGEDSAQLLEEACHEKDEHKRIQNFFCTIADILGTDKEAQRVMKHFLAGLYYAFILFC